MDGRIRSRRARSLRGPAVLTLVRFLVERGLSEDDIDRCLEYVEREGAYTIREGFVLAMSRALYTDDELAAGRRFTFEQDQAVAERAEVMPSGGT